MELTFKIDTLNKVKAIRPVGSIKFIEDGDRRLREVFEQGLTAGSRMFILDMRQVKYIDSNGLGQLIGALHHVHELGGDIKLFGLQQRVLDAMVLVRLAEQFDIFDDEAQAVAAYL